MVNNQSLSRARASDTSPPLIKTQHQSWQFEWLIKLSILFEILLLLANKSVPFEKSNIYLISFPTGNIAWQKAGATGTSLYLSHVCHIQILWNLGKNPFSYLVINPCFITPCFINPCFINPVHVLPIQSSPCFSTCLSLRLFGLRKATMGTRSIASMHRLKDCKTRWSLRRMAAVLGSSGLKITTKGIRLLLLRTLSFRTSSLGMHLALSISRLTCSFT